MLSIVPCSCFGLWAESHSVVSIWNKKNQKLPAWNQRHGEVWTGNRRALTLAGEDRQFKGCVIFLRKERAPFWSQPSTVNSVFSVALHAAVEFCPVFVLFSFSIISFLDEGLWFVTVHLDIDLGVGVSLVPEALEVTAVAEQVHGQAEAQHAHG